MKGISRREQKDEKKGGGGGAWKNDICFNISRIAYKHS
jgi:hypothetical protein